MDVLLPHAAGADWLEVRARWASGMGDSKAAVCSSRSMAVTMTMSDSHLWATRRFGSLPARCTLAKHLSCSSGSWLRLLDPCRQLINNSLAFRQSAYCRLGRRAVGPYEKMYAFTFAESTVSTNTVGEHLCQGSNWAGLRARRKAFVSVSEVRSCGS